MPGTQADAAVCGSCTEDGEYGRYRLWGAVGWGSMSTVAGAALDHFGIWSVFGINAAFMLPCACLGMYLHCSTTSTQQPNSLHRDMSLTTPKGSLLELQMAELPAGDASAEERRRLLHRQQASVDVGDVGAGAGAADAAGRMASEVSAEHSQGAAAASHGLAADGLAHVSTERFSDKLSAIFSRVDALHFFFTATVMGLGFGLIENYLFLLLKDMGAPDALLGLSLTVTCIAEVPVFRMLSWLMCRLGGPDALIDLCLGAYVLRMLLYALLPRLGSPWWVLLIEGLHGLTFGAGWGAGCEKSKALAPPGLEATQQVGADACAGRGRACQEEKWGVIHVSYVSVGVSVAACTSRHPWTSPPPIRCQQTTHPIICLARPCVSLML